MPPETEAKPLDTSCEVCGMAHHHHAAWCPKSSAAGFSQGKVHSDLHPDTRLAPSDAGINAEGMPLFAKDVPIG